MQLHRRKEKRNLNLYVESKEFAIPPNQATHHKKYGKDELQCITILPNGTEENNPVQ